MKVCSRWWGARCARASPNGPTSVDPRRPDFLRVLDDDDGVGVADGPNLFLADLDHDLVGVHPLVDASGQVEGELTSRIQPLWRNGAEWPLPTGPDLQRVARVVGDPQLIGLRRGRVPQQEDEGRSNE